MQKWNLASAKFLRKNEKPEQFNESLIKLEQWIDNTKHVCQAVGKKLLACLQLHGVERDKRLKKLPESALSKQLQDSSSTFDDKETIRQTLLTCGNVEGDLASMLMSYEDNIELSVLQPLQTLLERDIPAIMKLRKQVAKQTQEVESLKSRHSSRQTLVIEKSAEGTKKATQALEDMEEAVYKLELYKDQLVTEMYNFYAKEGDLNKIFTYLIESQLKYHSDATAALQKVLPEIKLIEQNAQRPVFGCSLEDHLRLTKQPIATVISESITALLAEGLDQEGLFRIAGGATKLKKLKAAFDAGMVDMDEYITDPHCVASALKLYLRELPEPLLTFDLYDDWAEASHLPPEQRLNAIASILKKMKKPYFDNLKYLIQFLSRLTDRAEVNKMSATNLAIVVGPNLLWSKSGDGQNILTTGIQSSITESMISNAALLFGDDSELGEMTRVVSSSQSPSTSSRSHSRDNSSAAMKQTIGKVDSNDSLSSDSLCADGAVVTNASSNSGSEVSSVTRSSEMPDVSNLVAPKRTARKTQAPLPPSTDATAQVAKATTSSVTKTPATSGNQEESTIQAKGATTTAQAKVAIATDERHGDLVAKPSTTTVQAKGAATMAQAKVAIATKETHSDSAVKPSTTTVQAKVAIATEETRSDSAVKPSTTTVQAKVAVTAAQAKVAMVAEEPEPLRKFPAAVDSNPVATARGDEKTQPMSVKRSTQFVANQALISNVLIGPRKLLLTRPNTVYMDHAKQELIKTAEEQIDGETNGAGNAHGKTGDSIQVDSLQVPQKVKSPLPMEEDGPTRDAKKDEPSMDEMCAAAELIGDLDSEGETKNPSPQVPRRSDGANVAEEPVRKKPGRPSKPVRSSQSDMEGGNKSSSGTKASEEDHSGREGSVAESSSAAKPHSESTAGARTQSASTAKHLKHAPPEVPHSAPQQPPSGGAGARPPKPPPPSVVTGSRLPSDSAVEEDTYL